MINRPQQLNQITSSESAIIPQDQYTIIPIRNIVTTSGELGNVQDKAEDSIRYRGKQMNSNKINCVTIFRNVLTVSLTRLLIR